MADQDWQEGRKADQLSRQGGQGGLVGRCRWRAGTGGGSDWVDSVEGQVRWRAWWLEGNGSSE